MRRLSFFAALAGCVLPVISSHAVDLKQARFTQVVNDVQVISDNQRTKPAAINDFFEIPDILRTGPNSRAELIAPDQTITRVGANTVFSFDSSSRTIDLQKGSLLFHSPKGRGGGTVQTGSATASVLGTTIIVTTTPNGGFKVLVLEGQAEVKFLNGLTQHLQAGQMTFVLPAGGTSPVIAFRLDEQTKGSLLVNGFDDPLPSWGKISTAIRNQLKLIRSGKAEDTGLLVGDAASHTSIQAIDPSLRQSYFDQLNKQNFQPLPSGNGYLTIDGFLVVPSENSTAQASDAYLAALALSLDININTATLNPEIVFINPGPFTISKPGDNEVTAFLPPDVSGVLGRTIHFNTATVDLSPYAELLSFDFFATRDININGSLTLNGLSSENWIYFTAGNQINIKSGSTLTADSGYLTLLAYGAISFNNVNIKNTLGFIDLASHSTMSLTGGSVVSGSGTYLTAPNGISINGASIDGGQGIVSVITDATKTGVDPALSFKNATLSGDDGILVSGAGDVNFTGSTVTSANKPVSLESRVATLNITDSSLSAGEQSSYSQSRTGISAVQETVNGIVVSGATGLNVSGSTLTSPNVVVLNSGSDLFLDHSTINAGTRFQALAGGTANIGSTAHGMNFSNLRELNISAHTINLINVAFGAGSRVSLGCDEGLLAPNPNTGAASLAGYVNFINGVTYDGTLITSANQGDYVSYSISQKPILIYQR